jgi:hypothetical protein
MSNSIHIIHRRQNVIKEKKYVLTFHRSESMYTELMILFDKKIKACFEIYRYDYNL